MTVAGPIDEKDRIAFWDVLRGVAVLGILLANMRYMSLAHALVEADDPQAATLDQLAGALVFFVADTKFITIFSLLFGAGLCWMRQRALDRGVQFGLVSVRRLTVLLLFGVAHGTLLWFGDILASYALLGFVLLLFLKRTTRTLLVWAGVAFLLGAAFWAVGFAIEPPDDAAAENASKTAEYRSVFASGDFARMLGPRAKLYFESVAMLVTIVAPRTLAMFLLGVALVKSGVFTAPALHRATFRRFLVIGLSVGIPLHVLALIGVDREQPAAWRVIGISALYFGGFAQAFGYIGAIALWCESSRLVALRARLAAVGRMAFTNYLMHSAITAVIFNYCGLFDRVDRASGLGIAVAIFLLQLWLSPRWLARFMMGPLEWLWRAATWRELPRMRRTVTAA